MPSLFSVNTKIVFRDQIDTDWSTDFMIVHWCTEVFVLHHCKSVSGSFGHCDYVDIVELP